jgi:uncharacterized membrane protein
MIAAGLALHALGAVIWVGGMFFAHLVLRPSAAVLEPAIRLPLWHRTLTRFFFWVWLAVAALLLSGFGMIAARGGFGAVGGYIHLMMGTGLLMTAIYVYLYRGPWQRFRAAVAREDWAPAQQSLGQIRFLVTVNLILGLLTVLIGSSGAYLG